MKLEIFGIAGMGEVSPGQNLTELIVQATAKSNPLTEGDVVVVTQKIVSKAEGRLVKLLADSVPGTEQVGEASPVRNSTHSKPSAHSNAEALLQARSKQIVRQESVRVLRQRGELIISETAHGFVCANAGVDLSNVPEGQAALLPRYPDRSAQRIRSEIFNLIQLEVAVIISDTFGRPWRRGLTDVAIGSSGIHPILDLRGELDASHRELAVTEVAIVDELAAAAEVVMGKTQGIPVAVVRGVPESWLVSKGKTSDTEAEPKGVVNTIVRHPNEDLFR